MHIEPAGTRPRCHALVPCAGTGSRAGTPLPKQYAIVAHQTVVAHTLQALAAVAQLETLLVVLSPDDDRFETLVRPDRLAGAGERLQVARVGGTTRAETVRNGLLELQARGAQPQDWVLVHDAARCLLMPAAVERLITACEDDEVGGLLALPVADTLKEAEASGETHRAARTLDRHGKWAAQTPQMFRLGLLLPALQSALDSAMDSAFGDGGAWVTDEASAVEALGHRPRLVPGDLDNLKLTFPADFAWAERVFAGRAAASPLTRASKQKGEPMSVSTPPASETLPPFRIGEGNDIHALVPGRPLVLGGLTLPHGLGLLGHSDADALLHAVTDAVLGAAGLGDIGRHFPDTDERFRGADSAQLLQEAMRRVREAGWHVVNVDATIVAQAPRLAAYLPAMGDRVAACLGVSPAAVNIKAKTAERMGPVGEGRAIETRAVCLLQRAG